MRAIVLGVGLALSPSAALAADLSTLVDSFVIERSGADGSPGAQARAVAIDSQGRTVVVGWIHGEDGHAEDAWLERFTGDGTSDLEVLVDGGPVDADRVSSRDRFFDVDVDSADAIAVSGALSADGWEASFYVAKLDADGEVLWDDHFRDGAASDVQAAHAVAFAPLSGDVVGAGWAWRAPSIAGQWLLRRFFGTTGNLSAGPIYHNVDADPYAPDQAWDVAVTAGGQAIVVGAVGVPGATSEADADLDWRVRKLDASLVDVLWEEDHAGAAGLADVARAVAIHPSGDVVVAGYTNLGADNHDGADFHWLVVRYDGVTGDVVWTTTWDSAGDAHDKAYAVAIDDGGDVIVGGSHSDGGVAAWRIARLAWSDGDLREDRTWPATDGHSAVIGVAVRDGRVSVAGYEGTATGTEAVLRVLAVDSDGDGTPDSLEECPFDPNKLEPGPCGCGAVEMDSDGDGTLDCHDACPLLPSKAEDPGVCGCLRDDDDRDDDGVPDCVDSCPDDPGKAEIGACGCGVPDDDTDGDGVPDCRDACPETPAGAEVDEVGCAPGQGLAPADDGPDDAAASPDPGCGCAAVGPVGSWPLLLLALLAVGRRRAA